MEKRINRSPAVIKAIMSEIMPRAIGEEAKNRAVESPTRQAARSVCSIYGGWGWHLFWCQRPACASTLLHKNEGLWVFFSVKSEKKSEYVCLDQADSNFQGEKGYMPE